MNPEIVDPELAQDGGEVEVLLVGEDLVGEAAVQLPRFGPKRRESDFPAVGGSSGRDTSLLR